MMVTPNQRLLSQAGNNNGNQTPNITRHRERYDPAFQSFDLHREREKLFKFLKIKENSQKKREELNSRMQDLMSKKELKFKKIEDRLKKDLKAKN